MPVQEQPAVENHRSTIGWAAYITSRPSWTYRKAKAGLEVSSHDIRSTADCRVPCDEANRKAECRKSARSV
jgi:hypothetical protein